MVWFSTALYVSTYVPCMKNFNATLTFQFWSILEMGGVVFLVWESHTYILILTGMPMDLL